MDTCSNTLRSDGLMPTMSSKQSSELISGSKIQLISIEPIHIRKARCCKVPDIGEINSRARHNLLLSSLRYSCINSDKGSGCRAAAGIHVHSRHNENFSECEPTAGFGIDVKHG